MISFLIGSQLIPAVAAPLSTAAALLVQRKQFKVFLLGFQYAMVVWLVSPPLPIESAIAKLLAGWISAAVLYLGAIRAASRLETDESLLFPRGRSFRFIAVLLVAIGTLGVSFDAWMSVGAITESAQRAASLMVALGILGIGLSINPLQVGISLITVVSGFEIVYSAVEFSLAIVALLALVHLGIALVVSYFEIIQAEFESEVYVEP